MTSTAGGNGLDDPRSSLAKKYFQSNHRDMLVNCSSWFKRKMSVCAHAYSFLVKKKRKEAACIAGRAWQADELWSLMGLDSNPVLIWDLRFCCLIFMNPFHWTWHWLAWDFPCVFPFNLPFPHSTTLYLCNYLILVPATGWILCTSRHLPVRTSCLQPLSHLPSYLYLPNSSFKSQRECHLLPLVFFFYILPTV